MSMRKDILTSVLAVIVFTVLLGLIYPLAVMGVGQLAFNNAANGSMIERGGKQVGSALIAQPSKRLRYFQPRPSQTGYNPAGTFFNNAGPNNTATRDLIAQNAKAYLKREHPFDSALTLATIPVDAATGSASGVDPHISQANARIQARRIAAVRRLSLATVNNLIAQNTDGRFLGVIGEPGVNVLELNLALDKEGLR
jgi:K+-transporting ATPase ATPase C chain